MKRLGRHSELDSKTEAFVAKNTFWSLWRNELSLWFTKQLFIRECNGLTLELNKDHVWNVFCQHNFNLLSSSVRIHFFFLQASLLCLKFSHEFEKLAWKVDNISFSLLLAREAAASLIKFSVKQTTPRRLPCEPLTMMLQKLTWRMVLLLSQKKELFCVKDPFMKTQSLKIWSSSVNEEAALWTLLFTRDVFPQLVSAFSVCSPQRSPWKMLPENTSDPRSKENRDSLHALSAMPQH